MSRFLEDKNTFSFPVCNSCKNHLGSNKCRAFDKIPEEILLGKNNHTEKVKGQKNDILFDPIID